MTPFMVLEEEKRPAYHKSRNTKIYHGEKRWFDLIETLQNQDVTHIAEQKTHKIPWRRLCAPPFSPGLLPGGKRWSEESTVEFKQGWGGGLDGS